MNYGHSVVSAAKLPNDIENLPLGQSRDSSGPRARIGQTLLDREQSPSLPNREKRPRLVNVNQNVTVVVLDPDLEVRRVGGVEAIHQRKDLAFGDALGIGR